jgi:hypothetical protein
LTISEPTVFSGFIGDFQQDPLLGINGVCLCLGHTKELWPHQRPINKGATTPFSLWGTYIRVKRSNILADEMRPLEVELSHEQESADCLSTSSPGKHTPSDLSGLGW